MPNPPPAVDARPLPPLAREPPVASEPPLAVEPAFPHAVAQKRPKREAAPPRSEFRRRFMNRHTPVDFRRQASSRATRWAPGLQSSINKGTHATQLFPKSDSARAAVRHSNMARVSCVNRGKFRAHLRGALNVHSPFKLEALYSGSRPSQRKLVSAASAARHNQRSYIPANMAGCCASSSAQYSSRVALQSFGNCAR